jgi:hypothetical protein
MSTKGQIVNEAYEELRISGLTSAPTPLDTSMALRRLEDMMAEFEGQWNMRVGYNFTVSPATTDQTNVPENFRNFMRENLAVRLIPAFGKEVPQQLHQQASQSFSAALGVVQLSTLQQVQPPRRMATGNGNTFRGYFFWNRFMSPVQNAPDAPTTEYIQQGETLNFFESYAAWLGNATISTFTIVADPLLTIDASAISGKRINYTVTAPADQSGYGPQQQIQITVTDSTGRTIIRTINFQVTTPPSVGPNP